MGSTIKYLVVCIVAMVNLTVNRSYAQTPAIAAEAVELCQAKKFQEALASIQKGIDDPQDSKHPFTWFVKGFIHKEIYKHEEIHQRNSQQRETAVTCFEKSLHLDDKREYVAQTHVALKYLASTYFNDAMLASKEFDLSSPEEYIKFFHTFRRLMRTVDPVTDLAPFERDMLKSAGQRYFEIWQLDTEQDAPANQAAAKFMEALGHDSTDCQTYYNLGVVYYNRAVFMYRSLNVDTEMDELITIQTESVGLLQKALQVFTNGQRICPENGDILMGLLYINKAFENEKNVEYFKSEIERLIDEGKIKKPQD
jgi:tetratricopeptide (TPR) repeat protein